MNRENKYDVAVVGGGLAGLCFSVLMAKRGYSVILFEKESYPFHKVCGEYISMESWDFLTNEIGVPLDELKVPRINKLLVTSPDGNELKATLDAGGFGISRYKLDNLVKEIAVHSGVIVKEHCKADDIIFSEDVFSVKAGGEIYASKCCCGAWGKRSNIDIKRRRPFTLKKSNRLNNYVGIKYHVTGDFPADTIALHNFKNGYCGLSKIEDDLYCLCYFMKASNLDKAGDAIAQAEQNILSANPHLKNIFDHAQKTEPMPFTISQVSLSRKNAAEDHILMLGDAAGMISPLCGNGMSIAMHSAKIAAAQIQLFLAGKISRNEAELRYADGRKKAFGRRIATGRMIQNLFGGTSITNIFVRLMKRSKFLTKKMIALTHGEGF